ncbi:MAG: hypothetical protein R3F59_29105 [Myxococcota bacterium]
MARRHAGLARRRAVRSRPPRRRRRLPRAGRRGQRPRRRSPLRGQRARAPRRRPPRAGPLRRRGGAAPAHRSAADEPRDPAARAGPAGADRAPAGAADEAAIRYDAAIAAFDQRGRGIAHVYRAFLALLLPERARALLDEAHAGVGRTSGRTERLLQAAEEVVAGGLSPDTRAALLAEPIANHRMLLRLCSKPPVVADDGSWLVSADGQRHELDRRPVLRRALAVLAEAGPGCLVPRSALVAGIWPGTKLVADSADARLHSTIRGLRRLGLHDALLTGEVDAELAYGLGAEVVVRISPGTADRPP